ncbi:hypothetical protein JN00_0133 [Metamycoplasma subdolum]|uniref:Uncharacterized protein n=1 Tax=Metamycoplasma subdolum TaxID=92407 RepID=A0A3M0A3W2_9BACT|nr:hypothetical protein [Metamycoplasma subdolum]RMA79084.1 hypothetical protein JN00_0133 [Metamycoplasma subdolum]WPB50607.1 hypothetical protein R9C05_00385 [Metamycoplasma subdolum]
MNTNFTMFDNLKILTVANLDNKIKSKIKTKTLLAFNIISILSITIILLCDVILFYSHYQFWGHDEYKPEQAIFFGVKIFAFFLFYMLNKFVINNILAKKLNQLKDEEIAYQNKEGYYLIYLFLSNKKVNKLTLLNRAYSFILFICYFAYSVFPFFYYFYEPDEGKLLPIFSLGIIGKYIVVDILWSYIWYLKIFIFENKIKAKNEMGNFVNYLFIALYFTFIACFCLVTTFSTTMYGLTPLYYLAVYYTSLFTIPIFYSIKVILLFILYAKEESSLKYFYIFMPFFAVYPL